MKVPMYDFVLAEFRKSGLTYRQISEGAQMSPRTVEKILRREVKFPRADNLQRLGNFFRRRSARRRRS